VPRPPEPDHQPEDLNPEDFAPRAYACAVAFFLSTLDERNRKIVQDAIDNQAVGDNKLSQVLRMKHYKAPGKESFYRHRKGGCQCHAQKT
jgi:hypothetical protein